MTNEDAIRSIERHMIAHRMGKYPHILIKEALEMAITALRAQQPPGKLDRSLWEGCDHCNVYSQCDLCKHRRESTAKPPCSECLDALSPATPYWEPGVIFCEECGRPLTEEAWAELERRINDGTTDN